MLPEPPTLDPTTQSARREPEVIECEAVPMEPGGRARPQTDTRQRPAARISGWFLVFAILAMAALFKLTGLAIAGVILVLRSPGAIVALLGSVAGWIFWRRWKAGRRTGGA